jgi:hypothetical protein
MDQVGNRPKWLGPLFLAMTIGLASWLILAVVKEQNENGDEALTQETADCLNRQLAEFIRTGEEQDSDACLSDAPRYAENPPLYALGIGLAVLVIGLLIQANRGRQ